MYGPFLEEKQAAVDAAFKAFLYASNRAGDPLAWKEGGSWPPCQYSLTQEGYTAFMVLCRVRAEGEGMRAMVLGYEEEGFGYSPSEDGEVAIPQELAEEYSAWKKRVYRDEQEYMRIFRQFAVLVGMTKR